MCNCIEEYNARLKAKMSMPYLQVDTNIAPDGTERICVNGVYKKVFKGGQLSKTWYRFQIPAKFCPFCGQPYSELKST